MFKDILIYVSLYVGFFAITFYVLSLWSLRKREQPNLLSGENLPSVTIIVPAFNESRGIQGTIKSALSIDYPSDKLDIVVIDDGSKDNTYKLASELACERVKVYRLGKNSGKGFAMNYGISKSHGEIIITMDADHVHVKPNALKKMIPYFNRPEVMCVSPMMAVYKPKGIWQRVQHIEYMFGIFLRKAFASVNAIHVTPGAFSAYRRNLFKKIGGFEARNITEDLEMSLRIQLHHYVIENSTEATIFTTAPKSFKELALQRRRWNSGLLKNLWAYRKLFSAKYGVLGILVLPIAIFVIMASLILSAFFLIRPFQEISRKLFLMNSINYNVFSSFEFKWYVLQNYLLTALTDPAGIFSIFFFMILIGHIIFAKRKINELSGLGFSLILFLIFYTFLFAFWWIISFFYVGFRKNISWR